MVLKVAKQLFGKAVAKAGLRCMSLDAHPLMISMELLLSPFTSAKSSVENIVLEPILRHLHDQDPSPLVRICIPIPRSRLKVQGLNFTRMSRIVPDFRG